MSAPDPSELGARAAALAARDLPLALAVLREAIRIPDDFVGRRPEDGGDPDCGIRNHEGPRLEYLRRAVVEMGAAADAREVEIDDFGNLVWSLEDRADGVPRAAKRVVVFDGHADTVRALRETWLGALGGGIDPYRGLSDPARVDWAALERELGGLPPGAGRADLLFGRGSADQLGGVAAQMLAMRLLRELVPAGALRGVIVRSYVTAAEEENEGGGPAWMARHEWPGAEPERLPDCVVLTEPSGHLEHGPLRICRGQRGRMQIEVTVTGKPAHGSMPHLGLNPLEYGGAILAEAAARAARGEGFLGHALVGPGTRTATWAALETPSDCAVPSRFVFRLDRRLTIGETPEQGLAEVESLESVRAARAAGLRVEPRVPSYVAPTWRGVVPGNRMVYMGWVTPEDHPGMRAAVAAYRDTVGRRAAAYQGGRLRAEPLLDSWRFSTDGVGYAVAAEDRAVAVPERKGWVVSGAVRHPAIVGFGPGVEQHAHTTGECVDTREVELTAAFLARFPSAFVDAAGL